MSQYLSFVALAALLACAPGPDTLLTLRATIVGGRRRGALTAAGVALAGAVQCVLAASGLGALILHAEPVFQTIRWIGVVYLGFLGVQALRAAWRTVEALEEPAAAAAPRPRSGLKVFGQGFLCNITNPKVLMFNLAVLPQFLGTGAAFGRLLAYALTLTVVGSVVLFSIVGVATAARRAWARRRVRRAVEGGTGLVMLGFAATLAAEA